MIDIQINIDLNLTNITKINCIIKMHCGKSVGELSEVLYSLQSCDQLGSVSI